MTFKQKILLLFLSGLSIQVTYSQSDIVRYPNTSDTQLGYQFTEVNHHAALDYIHSWKRHGIIAGIQFVNVKENYKSGAEGSPGLGLTLGYQFRLHKDPSRPLQPYITYRFLYNPSLRVSGFRTDFTIQEQTLLLGVKRRWNSGWYTFGAIGGLATHYIVMASIGKLPPDETTYHYSFHLGVGYSFNRGK